MILKVSLPDRPDAHEYTFRRARLVIGSGRGSDLRIPAPGVAPRHARLERRDQRIWLEPLKPGLALIIERINVGRIKSSSPLALLPGDRLVLGTDDQIAEVELIAADSRVAAPPEVTLAFRLADAPPSASRDGLEALQRLALAAAALDQPDALAGLLRELVAKVVGDEHVVAGIALFGARSRGPQRFLPAELEALLADRGSWPAGADWRRRLMTRLARGEALHIQGARAQRCLVVPLQRDERLVGLWGVARTEPLPVEALASVARAVSALVVHALDHLAQARDRRSVREENRYFRERERRHYLYKELVTDSPAMKAVYEAVNRLVDESSAVWIIGEKGTGKEMVARALHHLSARSELLMITENCTTPEEALDIELFGRADDEPAGNAGRPGLFEVIRGGTLFLEEIDRLPPRLQTKLSRTIREGEVRPAGEILGRAVDLRLIVSSERDLLELVETGSFRKDLYLRLAQRIIRLPPLRERQADIVPLADVFVANLAGRYRKAAQRVDESLHDALRACDWPGNVRQLQGSIEAAVIATPPEASTITRIPGLPGAE